MNAEQAKKSADAIILAFATIGTDWRNASRATEEIVKILTAGDAAPVEREYRAGKWMPVVDSEYWYICDYGVTYKSTNSAHETDDYRIKSGNTFPTEAIAEAAKAHADLWREFDMSDEGGICEIFAHAGSVSFGDSLAMYGNPKFKTEDNARAAIERLGGEQKVIDMLTRGRVFRFKWGVQ